MAEPVTRLRVFVASQSDVQEERERLEEVIKDLNLGIAREKGLVLELVRWETHAWPAMGEDAQEVVNDRPPATPGEAESPSTRRRRYDVSP